MNAKKLLIVPLVAWAVVVGAISLANEYGKTYQSVSDTVKADFQSGSGHFQWTGARELWVLSQYIDYTNLTDDQKTAIKTLMEDHQTKVKALMDSAKDTTWDDAKTALKTQMETLRKELLESLKTYVSSDKQDAFQTFIDSDQSLMMGGKRGWKWGMWMWFGNGEMWSWDMSQMKEYGILGRFVDTDSLTDDQKTEIKSLIESQKEEMQALRKKQLEALKTYVSSDKQAEFQTLIDSGENMMMWEWRGWMGGRHGWKWGMWEMWAMRFIDMTSLTDDQKTAIKTLMEDHQTKVKALLDSAKDATWDDAKTALKTQMETLRKSFLESLKTYVSSDKQTEFQTYIDNIGQEPEWQPDDQWPDGAGPDMWNPDDQSAPQATWTDDQEVQEIVDSVDTSTN